MDSLSQNWLNDAISIDICRIIIFQILDNEPVVMSFSIHWNEYKVFVKLVPFLFMRLELEVNGFIYENFWK